MQKEGIFRIGGFRVEVGNVGKGKWGGNLIFLSNSSFRITCNNNLNAEQAPSYLRNNSAHWQDRTNYNIWKYDRLHISRPDP